MRTRSMTVFLGSLFLIGLTLAEAETASAQGQSTTRPASRGGSSQSTSTQPAAAPDPQAALQAIGPLDLPIDKPVRGSRAIAPEPDPDPDPTAEPDPDPEPEPVPEPTPEEPPPEEPPTFYGEELQAPSQSIIYVIDKSESMLLPVDPFVSLDGTVVHGGNRFDRAKIALKRSIAALSNEFTFNVVFYDHCVYQWQPKRVEANDSNKARAFAFADSLFPSGFTNMGGAGYTALQDKENLTVVMLTDGEPNYIDCARTLVGDVRFHRALIRYANTQGATINTFGIGVIGQTRKFLQDVAADSGGTYTEITN